MAKVSKNGTNCTVTLHNDSTQNLLALEVAGEVDRLHSTLHSMSPNRGT